MWDERYQEKGYAYGTQANDFLAAEYQHLPAGRILSLAEGEGRNAVFLALKGYHVTALDFSLVGLKKTQALAQKAGVSIECLHADLSHYVFEDEKWDGIVSIFTGVNAKVRQLVHAQIAKALKPGGVFLAEAYTPEQVGKNTGGGNNIEDMQSADSLREELKAMDFIQLQELEREVIEGRYHNGWSSVLQCIAHKPWNLARKPL